MSRGKRTVTNKQDLLKEICKQLDLTCNPNWTSRGGTITGDALENILYKISIETGIPPNYLSDWDKYIWRLLNKSISALVLSLEVINKPTIPYRTETFLFLLLNAWELLLKAKIILDKKDIDSIKEKDKPDKTISFANALKTVFASEKNIIRRNLERIEELRNKAMHLFIPFVPPNSLALFQSCILNYEKMLNRWFDRTLLEKIPKGMLFLVANIDPTQFTLETPILSKHLSKESLEFLENWQNDIRKEMEELPINDISTFLLPLNLNISVVNNPKKSDIIASWDAAAGKATAVAIKYQSLIDKYPYSYTKMLEIIKHQRPEIKHKILNDIIRENEIKSKEEYSSYNFRNKQIKDEYKKTGVIAGGTPSIYNTNAIKFIIQKYDEDYAS